MRENLEDYALKYERDLNLEERLKGKGFAKIPTERIRSAHYAFDLTSCIRQKWYNHKGITETNEDDFEQKMTLEIGSIVDDIFSKMAMRARIYADEEWSFGMNIEGLRLPFSARIDLILEDVTDGKLYPGEVKSMKSSQFYGKSWKYYNDHGKLVTGGFSGGKDEPKFYHVAQLLSYIKKMGTPYGWLLYLCKDTSEFVVWKIYWSQEMWDDIVRDLGKLEEYIDLDVEPPRPYKHEISFYKRATAENAKGDYRHDQSKIGFPCSWKDADTGVIKSCRYRDWCFREEILESEDASEDLKEKVRNLIEFEESK